MEEDGNEEGLTHFGQSLGDIEKFSDVQLSDDDVEKGVSYSVSLFCGAYLTFLEDIRESHFGGFLKKKKSTPQQDSDVKAHHRTESLVYFCWTVTGPEIEEGNHE